jgi:2-dehydro-3-deoxyglucarate aldolase
MSDWNPFKRALAERRRLVGFWSALPSPLIAEMVALAGFDFALFDLEHAPGDLLTLIGQLHAVNGTPLQPVVRTPANDTVWIKRVLDIGFRNVLVPMVQTAAEAEAAVRATRYPPRGVRGVSAYQRNNRYGTAAGYFSEIDDHIGVVCQVETAASVERIPEIARVEGVDAVFVGPGDLAADLGHLGDVSNGKVQVAIARAGRLAREAGIPIGIVAPNPEAAERYLDAGFTFMTVGADIPVFRRGLDDIIVRLRSNTHQGA